MGTVNVLRQYIAHPRANRGRRIWYILRRSAHCSPCSETRAASPVLARPPFAPDFLFGDSSSASFSLSPGTILPAGLDCAVWLVFPIACRPLWPPQAGRACTMRHRPYQALNGQHLYIHAQHITTQRFDVHEQTLVCTLGSGLSSTHRRCGIRATLPFSFDHGMFGALVHNRRRSMNEF